MDYAVTPESDLLDALAKTLESHGITAATTENQVALPDSGLVFMVRVQPAPQRSDSTIVQLDVGSHAPILGRRIVWNSFAGVGASRTVAAQNAFSKFVFGPFHALLGALGNHRCGSDGTEWLDWCGSSGSWRVCASPLLIQGDASSVGYSTFSNQLREVFVSDVSPGLHWCDVFFASLNGSLSAAEVRLDNSPWPRASELLASWHVSPKQGYRSGRHFLVALPT
jgi:hypothetical protein